MNHYTIYPNAAMHVSHVFQDMAGVRSVLTEAEYQPEKDVVVFVGDSRAVTTGDSLDPQQHFSQDLLRHLAAFQQPEQQRTKTTAYTHLFSFCASFPAFFPPGLSLQRHAAGKPFWVWNHCAFPLAFSLSDTGPYWALAIGPENLGIDVEAKRKITEWQSLAQDCFSPQELAQVMETNSTGLPASFFGFWTRKEALLKWRGKEMPDALNNWDSLPGQHSLEPSKEMDPILGADIQIFSWIPKPDLFAALAFPVAVQRVFFFSNLRA